MNFLKTIKVISIMVLVTSINLACSDSDIARQISEELGGGVDSLSAPEISGEYVSSCEPDLFNINYRIIEITIDEDNFSFTESRYRDFSCSIALNNEPPEVAKGSLKVREELADGNGFFYEFLIPIDDNVSAVRLINIKKVDDEEINISNFFYQDEDFDLNENLPKIYLFK